MDDREVERLAEEVLRVLEVDGVPVDPEEIARKEGIRLLPGDYGGCFDGRLEYRALAGGGALLLFFAEPRPIARPESRVRFSIAHELGHYFLPAHREYVLSGNWHGSRCDFVSDKPTEREADSFAAALLMPRQRFCGEVERHVDHVCTLRDLESLADRVFRTSLTSTAIRYLRFNYEPCAVVLSDATRVRFALASEDMKAQGLGWIAPGSAVPAKSVTARAHAASGMDERAVPEGGVDSGLWFEGRRSRRIWEEARVLGRTGLVLTLMAVDEDEEEEEGGD